jgi:hypothetical protein
MVCRWKRWHLGHQPDAARWCARSWRRTSVLKTRSDDGGVQVLGNLSLP